MKSISLAAVVVGVVLLLCSFTWGMIFSSKGAWTAEQDARMGELGRKGHVLGGELDAAQRKPSMHARSAADIEAEYNQVKEEMAQMRAQFEGVRDGPKTIATILRWAGVACVAVGAFASYSNRG
jgi:hypothetical protein